MSLLKKNYLADEMKGMKIIVQVSEIDKRCKHLSLMFFGSVSYMLPHIHCRDFFWIVHNQFTVSSLLNDNSLNCQKINTMTCENEFPAAAAIIYSNYS